jgi:hypothetical protein
VPRRFAGRSEKGMIWARGSKGLWREAREVIFNIDFFKNSLGFAQYVS